MPNDPEIQFVPSTLGENDVFLEEYIQHISIPYDDFLEAHILSSKIYTVTLGGQPAGFFGVLDQLLTIFYVTDLYFNQARAVFEKIKAETHVTEAFIPTTDLGALSVALESYKEIQIQALHFTHTKRAVRPAEFGRDQLRLATLADLTSVQALAGDFLEDYEQSIKNEEIYLLEDQGELLGLGVLVQNQIMKNVIGTGMFAREDRRGQGIGRSIILHLKDIVIRRGKIPVPGCWYYNTNSRRTLESAGYITQSKLLRIVL
jgi:hypothetical protein